MEKMIIVDDNKRDRDGVAGIIDWSEYGIEIVHLCSNGLKALEYIKDNPVDIVLSDVEMPLMNGISLLKEINSTGKKIKFILMSCYDQFEFVKSAIEFGALGYILKPIVVEELENVIEKTLKIHKTERETLAHEQMFTQMVESNLELMTENFFRQIIFNVREVDELTEYEAKQLKIPLNYSNARVSLIKICSEKKDRIMSYQSLIAEYIETLSERNTGLYSKAMMVSHDQLLIILLGEDEIKDTFVDVCMEIKEYITSNLEIVSSVGISKESGEGLKELHTLYIQAKEALDTFYATENDRIILYDDVEEQKSLPVKFINTEQLSQEVNAVIAKTDIEMAKALVDKYLNDEDMLQNKNYIRYFSFTLMNIIESILINTNINTDTILESAKIWDKLTRIETIVDINKWFENIFKYVFETIELLRNEKTQNIVEEVKKIIKSEYATHITINYIAKKLHFSGVHINNIFKRETGMAIFDYLAKYRINKAKELLKEKDCKVYVVAKAVGYTNQTHFKLLFQQYTGMTPVEYKKIYETK